MKNKNQKLKVEKGNECEVMKNYSLFNSMDGVYAENRMERFQYIVHYSLISEKSHVC